jgi:hypothetical protein
VLIVRGQFAVSVFATRAFIHAKLEALKSNRRMAWEAAAERLGCLKSDIPDQIEQ